MPNNRQSTLTFSNESSGDCKQILHQVYHALNEKGYDPVGQIVGYLTSEDPTYITSSGGARTVITKVSRYSLMQELVRGYIEGIIKENK